MTLRVGGDGYFEFISTLLDLIHQEFPNVLADFQVNSEIGRSRNNPVVHKEFQLLALRVGWLRWPVSGPIGMGKERKKKKKYVGPSAAVL